HPLEIERILAPAKLHHPRRGVRGKGGRSHYRRREDAEEQSAAFHRMSPSSRIFRNQVFRQSECERSYRNNTAPHNSARHFRRRYVPPMPCAGRADRFESPTKAW